MIDGAISSSNNVIGFFGEPTATIDWCESNYAVSYFVAEFWNTLSSFWIFLPPIFGILDARKQGFEDRFLVGYMTLVAVGIGSVLFHMTLSYEMQLLDEVPMIYGTAAIGYCLCQIHSPVSKDSANWPLALFLLVYCLTFTAFYLRYKNPYIHETMFLLLVFSLSIMALVVIMRASSPKCMALFAAGMLCYFLGGVTWNLDNHICHRLSAARLQYLPALLRPLLQLHAWWHFFSGYGTYMLILAFIGYRQKYLRRDFDVRMRFFGPVIRLKNHQASIRKTSINNNAYNSKDNYFKKLG